MNIDIVAAMPGNNEKELIRDIRVRCDNQGSIYLASVCDALKTIGYPIHTSLVFYFSSTDDMYVFVRRDPLTDEDVIPQDTLAGPAKNRLYMKFKFQDQLTQEIDATDADSREDSKREDEGIKTQKEIWSSGKANRRTKERKISFVIEKVSMW